MQHAINWFEIPAKDFKRATAFYQAVLGATFHTMNMFGTDMAMLPADLEQGGVGGAIACGPDYAPASSGALVYLNCNPDLAPALARVEKAGGKVIVPKTQISPEFGHFALFIDTEGNKVGLHSQA